MISLQFQHGGVYRYHLVQTSKDKENYTYDKFLYYSCLYQKTEKMEIGSTSNCRKKNDGKCGELMFYNSYNKRNI